MKKIISKVYIALALSMTFSACNTDLEYMTNKENSYLKISTNMESTRAWNLDATSFTDKDAIGVFVEGLEDASNILAAYPDWQLEKDVLIPAGEFKVNAYYPYSYNNKVNNGFEMKADTKYLVASDYVSSKSPVAQLTFKQVMSRIRFDISLIEGQKIDYIKLSGDNIYRTAVYDFRMNEITNKECGEVYLTDLVDVLLIPAPAGTAKITFGLTNGNIYTTTVSLPELKMGGYYRLPITLKENENNPGGETDANGHEYVDLGLPSGLKWATCNVGANAPEEYGDYFAWGETSTKEDYYWETYKWCNGSDRTLTKYNFDSDWGIVDNKTALDLEDDAAHVNWGGAWRMPTFSEFKELNKYCTWTWYSINGHNGYKVTGTNGNSIFLPAAGYRDDMYLSSDGSHGCYWSSTQYSQSSAFNLYFYSYIHPDSGYYRYYGQSVRPVTE